MRCKESRLAGLASLSIVQHFRINKKKKGKKISNQPFETSAARHVFYFHFLTTERKKITSKSAQSSASYHIFFTLIVHLNTAHINVCVISQMAFLDCLRQRTLIMLQVFCYLRNVNGGYLHFASQSDSQIHLPFISRSPSHNKRPSLPGIIKELFVLLYQSISISLSSLTLCFCLRK